MTFDDAPAADLYSLRNDPQPGIDPQIDLEMILTIWGSARSWGSFRGLYRSLLSCLARVEEPDLLKVPNLRYPLESHIGWNEAK